VSEILKTAITVITKEAEALQQLASRLDEKFIKVVDLILKSNGKVIITGIGKSGRIGEKIASTLCSTGTPSAFLHAGEAMHGDLGIYHPGDPSILISKSGSTLELLRIIPTLREFNSPLIALTGNINSDLAQQCDYVLDASIKEEADPLGIVPTSSSIVTLALGDALASALMHARGFQPKDFARVHPAGQLGRNLLLNVADVMHKDNKFAKVAPDTSVKNVVITMTKYPLGAACVEDQEGNFKGFITEGDIRRALQDHDDIRVLRAENIMKKNPISIPPTASLADAIKLMEDRPSQISVLPVIEQGKNKCLGLLRIHDIYQPHLL